MPQAQDWTFNVTFYFPGSVSANGDFNFVDDDANKVSRAIDCYTLLMPVNMANGKPVNLSDVDTNLVRNNQLPV